MIKADGVYKRYSSRIGSRWVLQDINFEIPTGVNVALLGRNGSGKSTLLRLIGGVEVPDKGAITRDCSLSWPIGLSGGFKPAMTGRQNVRFVTRVQGREAEYERVLDFVQDFAEIGKAFDEPVGTYSAGMRSRLAFGLSLAFDFDVYISDEATSVGDAQFQKKAIRAFKDRVGKASLIIVAHNAAFLREICNSAIWLEDGRARWFDDVENGISQYYGKAKQVKKKVSATAESTDGAPTRKDRVEGKTLPAER